MTPSPASSLADLRHPRLRMQGPHVALPPLGASWNLADLPFADGGAPRHRRGPWLLVAAMVVGTTAVAGTVAVQHNAAPSGANPSAPSSPLANGAATTMASRRSTMARAPAATAPSTTVSPPATVPSTTASPPASTVPIDQLPPHEAVYRDGKLILQGTLPNQAVADRFEAEADAVIGAANVIVQYQFDPRVPEPTDGRVRVDDRFLFATGSSAVDPAYLPVFDLGVAVLRINPQATMRIRGYTDDRGSAELNLRLSQDRAQAAANYLVAQGIDPARLTVQGLGPAEPVAPNATDEGRAQNRRIEVDLFNLLA